MATSSEHGATHRPLRLTLTLWMLGVYMVIQGTLGAVLYLYQQHTAKEAFKSDLQDRLDRVMAELREVSPPWTGALLASLPEQDANGSVTGETLGVAALDDGGGLVAASDPSLFDPLAPAVVRARDRRRDAVRVARAEPAATGAREGQVLIVMRRFSVGGDWFTILLGSTTTGVAQQLAVIRRTLLLGMPIGLVAAGVGGWYIAGVAVAPLDHVRRLAERISPHSIGKPLDLEVSTSEMASLRVALNDALDRLDRGYRAQERFLTNVSHELKTPIAVVLAEAQSLRLDESLPDSAVEFAESTEQEMRRLGRLVESFLMLTRVRDAELPTMRLRCEVNALVIESVRHCRGFAQDHAVSLVPTLLTDDEIDCEVVGDPDLLRTMIDNLIWNAIRFSPRGGQVDVLASCRDDDVQIRVRDAGPGIPESLIDSIFDRFAQAPDEQRRGRGSGLGLEIAQGIAELHAGRIEVENRQAGGCVFRITLPSAVRGAATA